MASASRLAGKLGAPTSSRITSKGPWSKTWPGSATTAAPRSATAWRWSGLRTPATTRAPAAAARLDGGRADPAGGPVHQQPVAQAQAALGEQGVVGGGDHLGEPAGLGPGEPVEDRDRHPLVDHGQLGLAAPADHGHHPVALGEARATSGPTAATSPASSSPGMSAGLPAGAG